MMGDVLIGEAEDGEQAQRKKARRIRKKSVRMGKITAVYFMASCNC
jgi:hypothetical protein